MSKNLQRDVDKDGNYKDEESFEKKNLIFEPLYKSFNLKNKKYFYL